MTISGWRFKPRLWSTIGAAVVITIMVQLGNWQLSRAQEKESRQERLDLLSQEPAVVLPPTEVKLEDFQYRQVEARGEYVPGHTIYLDNKIYRGSSWLPHNYPAKDRYKFHARSRESRMGAGGSRSKQVAGSSSAIRSGERLRNCDNGNSENA